MRWPGIEYNEKRINGVHNAIVDIYLHGVRGVSPVRADHGHKQLDPDKADKYLAHANAVYAELAAQTPPRTARTWFQSNLKRLGDLIEKATAVRQGRAEQKMTVEGYAEYRRSLDDRFKQYR